ncbi:MAG TPA: zinc-ribbon domain containing protein [Patescibacteria group bacterium]|nr:zinc-ribbon domain containing protein [Patescibacteria group bacterium]
MSDLTLICQNCTNEFVFSAGEQAFYASKGLETPKYCPICRAIKAQERKIPAKPVKPIENKETTRNLN